MCARDTKFLKSRFMIAHGYLRNSKKIMSLVFTQYVQITHMHLHIPEDRSLWNRMHISYICHRDIRCVSVSRIVLNHVYNDSCRSRVFTLFKSYHVIHGYLLHSGPLRRTYLSRKISEEKEYISPTCVHVTWNLWITFITIHGRSRVFTPRKTIK